MIKTDRKIIMNAISNLGFEVFKNGQFHWNSSNTPDMYINQDGSIHCWTSSPFKNNTANHGDLIDFLQVVNHNQNFKEAKEEAERLTGLTLPSLDSYKDNGYTIDNTNRKTGFIDEEFIKVFDVARRDNFERYKELLNEALPSLDFEKQKEIAQKYQIGYIEQSDRLSMPIKDDENRIVTLWKYNKNPKSYINDKGLEVTPGKVLFTKGRERSPFNLYDMQEFRKDLSKEVFLCGGEKDTLNMLGNGHRAITLGSENENLKDRYKPLFQDLKIVIAYDNDKAGVDGANKIAKQLQGVAKEIKIWDWKKIENKQELNLSKGYDMTDYLVDIKKYSLEFDKTNYLEKTLKNEELKMKKILNTYELEFPKNIGLKIEFNPDIEQSQIDKIRENKYLFAKDDLSQIKVLTLRNNGEYAVRDIDRQEAKQELERYYQAHLIKDWKIEKENVKETQKIINQNEVNLLLLDNSIKNYTNWILNYKKENIKMEDKAEKKDFVPNSDFFQKKSDSIQDNAVFLSKKIKNVKEKKVDIDEKLDDYAKNPNKEELFKSLEAEIADFTSLVENLKKENRQLKQELELLIEKEQKKEEKQKLEKENSSLKEKIEKIREKNNEISQDKEPLKAEKINKISYKNNEKEAIHE